MRRAASHRFGGFTQFPAKHLRPVTGSGNFGKFSTVPSGRQSAPTLRLWPRIVYFRKNLTNNTCDSLWLNCARCFYYILLNVYLLTFHLNLPICCYITRAWIVVLCCADQILLNKIKNCETVNLKFCEMGYRRSVLNWKIGFYWLFIFLQNYWLCINF